MAQSTKYVMNIEHYPEVNLAIRLIEKKNLIPPIDIFSLVKQYAKVDLIPLPFDIVDGISLHLKVPGKTPQIIINNRKSDNRMRFTLAHELGHILIPWHLGSIIDNTLLPAEGDKLDEYGYLEMEANRFASELLMPSIWVKNVIEEQKHDIYKITEQIVKKAGVSPSAATIKIKDTINPGYLFAVLTEDNEVIFSGRSKGTRASLPVWKEKIIPDKLFTFCQNRYQFKINRIHYYWWAFDENISIPQSVIIADWRKLLDEIIAETGVSLPEQKKLKQFLNGIISNANSCVKGKDRTLKFLYNVIQQRIHSHSELKLEKLINHPKFNSFICSRIESLLD